MNIARSAKASATFNDCSTMIIVWPACLEVLDDAEQFLDDERCQTQRELVDQQDLGLVDQRHGERQHLLLAAGELPRQHRSAVLERGEQRQHPSIFAWRSRPVSFVVSSDACRFSATLSSGNTPAPPTQLHDALPEPDLGVDVGQGPAVESHDPAVGDAEAADRVEERRLAGPVGAEQRQHLTPASPPTRRRTAPGRARS